MSHRFDSAPTVSANPARSASAHLDAPPSKALSIVVVNYRRRDDSVQLTNQLDRSDAVRGDHAEIVIVDNDDNPKPLKRWAANRPGVHLLSLGRNRGFARAVNEGCRIAKGDWFLLLNPDVRVPDEFADKVLAAAERIAANDPNVGVIGFELLHADGTKQPSAGPFPTLGNVMTGLVRSRHTRRCRDQGDSAASVAWVTGCCLLVRRSCWLELGGFDEDFFLYYEDVDLCRRARAIGWTVWYEPGLHVTHYHPLHSRNVAPPMRLITRYALLTYAAKHWPRWQFRLLGRLIRTEAGLRRIVASLMGRAGHVAHFQRLGQLAADLVRGRLVRARATLLTAARALAAEPLP